MNRIILIWSENGCRKIDQETINSDKHHACYFSVSIFTENLQLYLNKNSGIFPISIL
ncbi:hypothetical protein [Glaesserella sp. 15-184]|uniref:hypothetical protein n=1 Tax=Glaesserella sp. 15-184 TaxID=2030797 RepID=UPI0018641950|nr:hypothetical protein [Glaesserella sp. 15-184]